MHSVSGSAYPSNRRALSVRALGRHGRAALSLSAFGRHGRAALSLSAFGRHGRAAPSLSRLVASPLAALAGVALVLLLLATSALAVGTDLTFRERRMARIRRLGPIVTDIHFIGNEAFEAKQLKRYMLTQESGLLRTHNYRSRQLARDLETLERFYRSQGFFEAMASAEDLALAPDSLHVEVVIGLYEGDRWTVSGLSFQGNTIMTETEVRHLTALRPGDPLVAATIEADRLAILDEYARRSHLDARVFQTVDRDDEARTASISYRIVEREQAMIGVIEITGDDKTRQYVIERELKFESGQLFDPETLGESQANVYRTGLFNSVWIEPAQEDTGKVVKKLALTVNERPSGVFDFTFGYAVIDGLQVGMKIGNQNVQGQATRLGVESRYSQRAREARVSIGDPYFTGRRIGADASASYSWNDEEAYVGETTGGSVVFSKRLGRAVTVEGGYEYERTSLLEIAEEIEEGDRKNDSSVFPLAATYDTRDDLLNSRRGMLARAEVDFAGTLLGGDNEFVRTGLYWRGFKKLGQGRVAALSTRVGWIKPQGEGTSVPVNERYFAGGDGSVRGFDRNSLGPRTPPTVESPDGEPKGGRALLEVRGEIRFPVWREIRMVGFVDAGQVYEDWDAMRLDGLAVGGGLGVRYVSRFGVFRLDVATSLTEAGSPHYYFGIGQAF
jgi:outer membrane protein insertion porin family